MSLAGLNAPVVDVSGGRSTPTADTGGTFVAVNPTPGTGIISATPITLAAAATAATMVVYNGNVPQALPSTNVNIYPLYLKLVETAASTGGTQLNFQFHTDVVNRYTSGGTALVLANTSSGSNVTSKAVINFGALTTTATNNDKFISANLRCRVGLIDILGDQLLFTWGCPAAIMSIPFQTVATIGNFQFGLQAASVAPGNSMVFTIWQPTTFTTGVTYEVEFGYLEK
jgi:hypothetical protein